MRYSVESREYLFKAIIFFSFTKSIGKNIGKNKRKNLRGKYRQELLDHAKQSVTDALKTTFKISNSKNRRSN